MSESTYLNCNVTNTDNLYYLDSYLVLKQPILIEDKITPLFPCLVMQDIFYFSNPLYVEYQYFNSTSIEGLNIHSDLGKIAYNGYYITNNNLSDPNFEVLIAQDWMHQRGTILSRTKIGKGNLIVSSTETFWTTYGQYFNRVIMNDAYDFSNIFAVLLHILTEKRISIKIEPNYISMLISHLSIKLVIVDKDFQEEEAIVIATGFLSELNSTVRGFYTHSSRSLIVSFPLPLLYSGNFECHISIKVTNYISTLIHYQIEILMAPFFYDVIMLSLVIIVAFLIIYSSMSKN